MSSDLEKLKIDRGPRKPSAAPKGRRGRGPGLGRWIVLASIAAGLWLFRAPLLGVVDAFALPTVEVHRVSRSHPASVGAVQGKAANGYIVASRRAALSADTPGRIEEIRVTEGSEVREGEVVARLYSEEYEADLRAADAEWKVAQAEVEAAVASVGTARAEEERARAGVTAAREDDDAASSRQELAAKELRRVGPLVEEGTLSEQELDRAEMNLADLQAQKRATAARVEVADKGLAAAGSLLEQRQKDLEVARARVATALARKERAAATLDKTQVRAPFDGIVVLKDAEVGEVVSPNSQGGSNARGSVCTMVDFESLEVQAEVPELSLDAVRVGGRVQIFLDAFPDDRHGGEVARIWPTANRQKATVEVRIRFDEILRSFRPEMGVRVIFLPEDGAEEPADDEALASALLVPEEAVVRSEGRSGVFVLERDRVHWRPIQLGGRRSGKVVAEGGLEEGEEVVLSPPASLEDGDRVQTGST